MLGLWILVGIGHAAATAVLSGKITDPQGQAVAGAHVFVAGPIAAGQLVVRSDSDGSFEIPALPPGLFQIEVLKEGFFTLRQELQISGAPVHLDMVLTPQQLKQAIDVVASLSDIDPQQTSRTRTLTQEQIDILPFAPSYSFSKALTLLPGVAIDQFGRIHVNGGASDQTVYLLDGFNLSSPVSGTIENNINVDAVRTADVRSSRYSAEYGKGSAGVISVTTRTGDDRFRYHLTDFIPSYDRKEGAGFFLKDWAPRLLLSGPVLKGKVWFLNSLDGKFDLDVTPGLPKGANRSSTWRWSDLFRLQAQLGASHLLGLTYLHNRINAKHVGLDLVNPLETTRDIGTKDIFFSVKDQGYWHGVLSEVGFGVNRLGLRKDPRGDATFILAPDSRRGNFFLRTNRHTERWEWLANFMPKPVYRGGRHEVKFGFSLDRILYSQRSTRRPYETVRADGLLWRKTFFAGSPLFIRNNTEWSAYVQDRWSPVSRLLLEAGVRHDWDEVIGGQLVAPRLAVTLVPWAGKDLKLSAGIGLFYDATNLSAIARTLDQRQFDSFYFPDGRLSWGPAETAFRMQPAGLRAPRLLNWSAGWEQKLPSRLVLHGTFMEKHGARGFTFSNLLGEPAGPYYAIYELKNIRRDRHRSFEFTLGQPIRERARWNASYVRSSTWSNAVLDYTIENPFFQGQGAGPVDWDIPNRVLGSGWVPLGKKYTFSYFAEWHDGMPFSVVDGTQALVGPPNRMRFPAYFSLNTHVEREIETGRYRWSVRVGFNNVTGHDNFSLVNNNIDSPLFLRYGGNERRSMAFRIRYRGRK